MSRRTLRTLILLIGIATGVMLGVALSSRAGDGGRGVAWTSRTVTVRIYTTVNWHPLIERSIADFNAIMPRRGPRLVMKVQGERSCAWVKRQTFRKPTITMCSQPDGNGAGWAVYRVDHGTLAGQRVWITLVGDPGHDRYQGHQNTVCHELMHAVSGVNDGWGEPRSCVRGDLDAPGAWDVAYLERVYANTKGRRRGNK